MPYLFNIILICLGFVGVLENNQKPTLSEEFMNSSRFNSAIDLDAVDHYLIEMGVLYLSNEYRQKKGKQALAYNTNLSLAAFLHSEQMQSHRFFAHVNKRNKQLSSMDKRATAAGYHAYQTLAENIYYGAVDISNPQTYRELCSSIVDAFIQSKGHRVNLLATDVHDMGCGISFEKEIKQGYWYFYFTQDFGKQ